jgi:hypothetical protein
VTNSLDAAQTFATEIKAGLAKVREPTSGISLNVPLWGVESSSTNIFLEQGSSALDFFTWAKSIYLSSHGPE